MYRERERDTCITIYVCVTLNIVVSGNISNVPLYIITLYRTQSHQPLTIHSLLQPM